MMRHQIWTVAAFCGALLSFVTVVQAQDFNPYAGYGQLGLIINQTAITQAAIGRQPKPSAPAANPALLRFTPSLPLRKSMEAQLAVGAKKNDPSGTLSALLKRTPPVAAMHKRMATVGFAPNDLGSAVAIFLATQWALANGSATLPPRAQVLGLKAQYGQGLSLLPQIIAATDAAKQQYAEGLLLKAYVFSSLMEAADGDAKTIAQLRAGAVQELKDFGIDHAQVSLTAQGFVAAE